MPYCAVIPARFNIGIVRCKTETLHAHAFPLCMDNDLQNSHKLSEEEKINNLDELIRRADPTLSLQNDELLFFLNGSQNRGPFKQQLCSELHFFKVYFTLAAFFFSLLLHRNMVS